jgi:hypothetical protein
MILSSFRVHLRILTRNARCGVMGHSNWEQQNSASAKVFSPAVVTAHSQIYFRQHSAPFWFSTTASQVEFSARVHYRVCTLACHASLWERWKSNTSKQSVPRYIIIYSPTCSTKSFEQNSIVNIVRCVFRVMNTGSGASKLSCSSNIIWIINECKKLI